MKKRGNENHIPESEWSYLFDTEALGREPATLKIAPDESQTRTIVKRLAIDGLEGLEARITLRRNTGNMVIHVQGIITAKAFQKCIITLAPLEIDIEAPFEAWYADSSQTLSFTKAKRERDIERDNIEQPILDEAEDPEPVVDGRIDLGELVVQHLSLNIDPYPRAIGASYALGDDDVTVAQKTGEAYHNPFEALKNWRDKEGKS